MTNDHQRPRQHAGLPPAGWYTDPGGSGRERYWEGTRWTKNLRDAASTPDWVDKQQANTPPVADPAPVADSPRSPEGFAERSVSSPLAPPPGAEAIRLRPGVARTGDGVPLASFLLRAAATALDFVVVVILGTLVALPYVTRIMSSLLRAQREGAGTTDMAGYDYATPLLITQLITLGVAFVSQVLLVKFFGATVGQLVMGLRVVRVGEGLAEPGLGWLTSLKRSLVWLAIAVISVWALWLPMAFNYLRVLWTPRQQTLHDLFSGTQVITVRDSESEALFRAHRFHQRHQAAGRAGQPGSIGPDRHRQ